MLSSNGIQVVKEKDESAPQNASPLAVEISDAISEKESVKFTIVIKTSMSSFTEARGSEFKTNRIATRYLPVELSVFQSPMLPLSAVFIKNKILNFGRFITFKFKWRFLHITDSTAKIF